RPRRRALHFSRATWRNRPRDRRGGRHGRRGPLPRRPRRDPHRRASDRRDYRYHSRRERRLQGQHGRRDGAPHRCRGLPRHDVRALNVSWGAPQATSYHRHLLSALVEAAWFSGITAVVAVGNDGPDAGTVTAPATDPFVVSVGSYNDMGTLLTSDDVASTFTARGPTLDGFVKP